MAKQVSSTIYPLSALRAMVLHLQHLTAPNDEVRVLTPEAFVEVVEALGYVQIDTLQVVNRAHYVTLWSRLGSYRLDALDRLLYSEGRRRLYEGWGHAASIISLNHYRYHRWRIDNMFQKWLNNEDNRVLADQTLERIRDDGGMRSSDFKARGPNFKDEWEWYNWKPSKMALESLFAYGDLMVSDRVKFQRVYDITERVMPEWVDTSPVPEAEARRFVLEQAAKALGVFEIGALTWYAYMFSTPAKAIIREITTDGTLVEIQGESTVGVRKWLVHRDNLPLLQRAADGEITPQRTTFIAPYDSLLWAGERDQRLFGFNQVLECYKPEKDRVYGYFCFPILHHDRLVGRFDPKLDRKSGLLTLNALYLEPDVVPDDELVSAIAGAMRDFMDWHGATGLRIEKSDPAGFDEKLEQAV